MPLYDYACTQCNHAIEVIHGVNEPGPSACERCGGPMRKLLSPPAIVFKGSGWAKKDAQAARPKGAKGATDADSDHRPAVSEGTPASATKPATGKSDSPKGTSTGSGTAADT